jgi:hypothetical protein
LERLIGLHWVLSASATVRVHNVLGDPCIDLAGQLDETRMLTVFASLPCQIKRIDRDTTPANTKAGINGLKPNGFLFAAPITSHMSMAIAE